ncbi:uncharacterized protein METZ01_LOCUS56382 [marine metagenome]|uniref:Uncharacterized protein n=1 Tax=marine metagenome TaxID=408172 RepID=A0A381SJS4_9ZZZZ
MATEYFEGDVTEAPQHDVGDWTGQRYAAELGPSGVTGHHDRAGSHEQNPCNRCDEDPESQARRVGTELGPATILPCNELVSELMEKKGWGE